MKDRGTTEFLEFIDTSSLLMDVALEHQHTVDFARRHHKQ